jgi:hypothetical protein
VWIRCGWSSAADSSVVVNFSSVVDATAGSGTARAPVLRPRDTRASVMPVDDINAVVRVAFATPLAKPGIGPAAKT